jgi:hypothetical protein
MEFHGKPVAFSKMTRNKAVLKRFKDTPVPAPAVEVAGYSKFKRI